MKVLVVDDEELLVKGIRFNLQNDGYEVITGCNGAEAVALAQSQAPDLIILDVMMPEMDGLTACAKIREFSNVPIILLTAKAEDMDKLMGFDNGADDYLTKPFEIVELLARVESILRRAGKTQTEIVVDDIVIDTRSRSVRRGSREIQLTMKEFELLLLFARNKNIALFRETLYENVWGSDFMGDSRTVDVHIKRLREKLEGVSTKWQLKTVWGVGYKFDYNG